MLKKISMFIIVGVLLISLNACTMEIKEVPDNKSQSMDTENDSLGLSNEVEMDNSNAKSIDSASENKEEESVVDEDGENASGVKSKTEEEKPGTSNKSNTADVIDPEPESKEKEITLYYANNEYILTGDESLDKIIPVKKKVMVGDKPIEEIVVRELQNEPSDENLTSSFSDIEILSVDTVDKIAYVNISSKNLSGGSLTETLTLQQLVYSLTELDEVEAVQVLVDGSKQESLMGHITILEPLRRED